MFQLAFAGHLLGAIDRVAPDDILADRSGQAGLEHHVHMVPGGRRHLAFQAHIELVDVGWLQELQRHLAEHRLDVDAQQLLVAFQGPGADRLLRLRPCRAVDSTASPTSTPSPAGCSRTNVRPRCCTSATTTRAACTCSWRSSRTVEAFTRSMGGQATFTRLAVTPDQIRELGLPTAPPKDGDRRAFTGETCQAEAIAPDDLAGILQTAITSRLDMDAYAAVLAREEDVRRELMERLGEAE